MKMNWKNYAAGREYNYIGLNIIVWDRDRPRRFYPCETGPVWDRDRPRRFYPCETGLVWDRDRCAVARIIIANYRYYGATSNIQNFLKYLNLTLLNHFFLLLLPSFAYFFPFSFHPSRFYLPFSPTLRSPHLPSLLHYFLLLFHISFISFPSSLPSLFPLFNNSLSPSVLLFLFLHFPFPPPSLLWPSRNCCVTSCNYPSLKGTVQENNKFFSRFRWVWGYLIYRSHVKFRHIKVVFYISISIFLSKS